MPQIPDPLEFKEPRRAADRVADYVMVVSLTAIIILLVSGITSGHWHDKAIAATVIAALMSAFCAGYSRPERASDYDV